ncbi:hypothetical protein CRYUN_Cryun06bG0012200 [Craigia yunnanensis]
MAEIVSVPLQANHEARLRFRYTGRALPGGSSVLMVTDGSESWKFECQSEGGNYFSISGSEWKRFAKPWIGKSATFTFTLYSKEEGENFHRIRVRQ